MRACASPKATLKVNTTEIAPHQYKASGHICYGNTCKYQISIVHGLHSGEGIINLSAAKSLNSDRIFDHAALYQGMLIQQKQRGFLEMRGFDEFSN